MSAQPGPASLRAAATLLAAAVPSVLVLEAAVATVLANDRAGRYVGGVLDRDVTRKGTMGMR